MFFNDGVLANAFGAISNTLSGFGSNRDPLASTEINITPTIGDQGLEFLYRSNRIVEKCVTLLPEDALSEFPTLQIGNELEGSIDTATARLVEQQMREYEIKDLFCQALISARLYGNGYIIMGINDGQDDNMSLPLNENTIRSIDWLKVSDTTQILPFNPTNRGNFTYYQLINSELHSPGMQGDNPLKGRNLIHKSRVLSFPGKKLFGNMKGYNYGKDDSIIQAMFAEFVAWSTAIASSGNMINSHSLFKYKLKGLRALTQQNDQSSLYKRFSTMMMGLSTLKGYVLDADGEDIDFASRNYGGVQPILAELKESLASACGMPYTKLWGTPHGSAFTESGASDRYAWSETITSYRSSVIDPVLNHLTRLLLLANNRQVPTEWEWIWRSPLQLTLKEKAELKRTLSDADFKYINMGVLHPMEVRSSRFGDTGFGDDINLDQQYEEVLMMGKENNNSQNTTSVEDSVNIEFEGDVLNEIEFDDIATITEEDKKRAVEHWKNQASEKWRNILEADVES